MLTQYGLQSLVYESGFSGTAHSRYNNEFAKRKLHIDILQIVAPCATEDDAFAVAVSALFGYSYLPFPVEVIRSDGVVAHHLLRSALKHHFTTMCTSLWTNVDDIVGIEHHVFVVFYDNHGVAQVPKLFE